MKVTKLDARVSGYKGDALSAGTGGVPGNEHSGLGVIPDGAYLSEGVAVRNIGSTSTAKKGFWLDEFAFKLNLPSARTGFAFT